MLFAVQDTEAESNTDRLDTIKRGMQPQADSESQVLGMWLHGTSPHTEKAYRHDVEQFLRFAGVGLRQVTLSGLQAYSDSIAHLADTSRSRKLSAVKSVLSFAHRMGYTRFNVGAVLRGPKVKNGLAERILSEADVQKMIALEPNPRNRVLLTLLYAHASHALDRGCPIHLVQATLGHASVATTGKYIHARPTESSAKYLAV